MNVTDTTWSKIQPTEIGWYWFYGWKGQWEPHNRPAKLYSVEILIEQNGLVAISEGQHIHRPRGFWCKAKLPNIKELTDETD